MARALLSRFLETPDESGDHMSRGQLEGKANGCMRSAANWRGADSPRSADANIVDIFPARRPAQDLPTPLPGMGRERQTDEWKLSSLRMLNAPYGWLVPRLRAGSNVKQNLTRWSDTPAFQTFSARTLLWARKFPSDFTAFERPQAGIPHMNAEDDMYEGYFVPKQGTMVMGNFLGDPRSYPDPDKAMPERFLAADGQLDMRL